MMWLLVALCEPASHAVSNILDSYLNKRLFNSVWVLIFYGMCFQVLLSPLVWLIDPPGWPAVQLWPWLVVIGFIQVAYLYPYYKALQNDSTSTVVALFSLGNLCVPLFAFIALHERLAITQYFGFLIVIIASILLTLQPGKLKLNKSLWYMLLSSALLSVEVVVYKYVFNQVSWGTGFFWPMMVPVGFISIIVLYPKFRHSLRQPWQHARTAFPLLFLEEFFAFSGIVAGTYAVSLVPVTIERTVGETQPFFVLLYSIILMRFMPGFPVEAFTKQSVIRKACLFILMTIGVGLVAY